MSNASQPEFLLASVEAELIERAEPALAQLGHVQTLSTPEALLQAVAALPQAVIALDTRLPGMEIGQLLAAMRVLPGGSVAPVVLFSDTVTEEWRERLREGVISDLVPVSMTREFLAVRVGIVLAAQIRERELERLRERDATVGVTDPLTGVYNRSALLPLLFRETDRVQRMKTSLCLILMDIDDFGHWNVRLGTEACDDALAQTAGRVRRMLRSYDLLGRVGKDEFLAVLPGCTAVNAMTLAERIRQEVFAAPFEISGKAIRLSACFAVASSQGRSPVVVLRELEEGLIVAKQDGPETIRLAAEWLRAKVAPVQFLSPSADEDLVTW